jgi:DNA-binding transcriptional regulator YdaS (Cro superfamily)
MLNRMNAITPEQRGALAQELGIDPLYLYQLLTGRREMEPKAAVRLEQRSGLRLRRWHLRAKTWHEVWPELIGAEGAPPVPHAAEANDAA